MATIGLDKLYYAKITEGTNGDETYIAPVSLATGDWRLLTGDWYLNPPLLPTARYLLLYTQAPEYSFRTFSRTTLASSSVGND